jgi:hypothetical protein
MERE